MQRGAKAQPAGNAAGFGGTPEQINALYSAGFEGAVHSVLNGPDDSLQFPKPSDVAPVDFMAMREQYRMLPDADRKEKFKEMAGELPNISLFRVNCQFFRLFQYFCDKLMRFYHSLFFYRTNCV